MTNKLSIAKVGNIFIELFKYDIFIETGTFLGNTTLEMSPYFKEVHTIELSEKYFSLFLDKIKKMEISNINCHFGDSSKIIPTILKKINKNKKCIFWLDGHWSSGDSAKGNKDCPLIDECLGINEFYSANEAIILIDDFRLFGVKGDQDWTDITLDSIKKCFTKFKIKNEIIFDDCLMLRIKKI